MIHLRMNIGKTLAWIFCFLKLGGWVVFEDFTCSTRKPSTFHFCWCCAVFAAKGFLCIFNNFLCIFFKIICSVSLIFSVYGWCTKGITFSCSYWAADDWIIMNIDCSSHQVPWKRSCPLPSLYMHHKPDHQHVPKVQRQFLCEMEVCTLDATMQWASRILYF